MMKGLLAFALTRRAIILLGLLIFAGGGLFAFSMLNIEAYPNPAPVIIEITAQAPGLSAEEMERYYTVPMEIGVYSTPGIANVRSTSFYGLSYLRVTFKYGVDFFFAYTQLALSLQQNVNLPGNQQPQIQQSSLIGEVFRYQVTGPKTIGLTNLRTVQDWIVQRRLLTIPGVVQINSFGGPTKEFEVEADLRKLQAYNLTVPQVLSALANANINVGGREIAVGQQSVNIRGIGLVDSGGTNDLTKGYSVSDIENVVLTQTNGTPVLVRDVARCYIGHVPRLGIVGRDHDDDTVEAIVVMGRTYHTNEIVPRIAHEVEAMNHDGSLPPGVKIVPFYDRTGLVRVTTHTVLHNLVFGCLLVFIIQWMFLGDLRSAVIVGVNIPFALFFSVILLVIQGEDANLLSVGAVDFGIIVDSAVIVVENIFRNFQAKFEERRALLDQLGEGRFGRDPSNPSGAKAVPGWTDRVRLILASVLQVDRAVFFSAAITVAAFVPLFTMQGVEGQIFGPMARTYGYALAGALIATFTITPVLSSFLVPEHVKETETIAVRWLRKIYTPALRYALSHQKTVVGAGVVFLLVCGFLMSRAGSEFLPALEEGNFWIRASLPPSMTLDGGTEATRMAREIMLKHPEIITVVSQHGRPDNGSDPSPFSNVELFAPLKPFDQWSHGMTKEKLTAQLQKEFQSALPGVEFNFSQNIQDNIEEAISGVKGANSVKIIGPDLMELERLAAQVRQQMAGVRGVADLGIFHVVGQPNLNIRVDRRRAARYGLNTGDVNAVIQAALGGAVATQVLEADRSFNLTVRFSKPYRDNLDAIRNLKIGYQSASGATAYIPLSELATIQLDTGASYIYHEVTKRNIAVKFSVRGRDLGSTVAEAQDRIASHVKLPLGYRIDWAGEFEDLQMAKKRLAMVVPIALAMILVLLYALFNSLRYSAGADRSSFRRCRRRTGAVCLWSTVECIRRDRLCFVVGSRGHGRHPHVHLFQPHTSAWHPRARGHVPGLRTAHAADADDRVVSLYRSAARRDLHWHREPGSTPSGHRGRRWHVAGPRHVASGCARTAAAPHGKARRSGTGGEHVVVRAKRRLLLVLLLWVFAPAFGADRGPGPEPRAQSAGAAGAHYASPNAAALRKAIGTIGRRSPRPPAPRTLSRNMRSPAAVAQPRGTVPSTRGPLQARRIPGEIGAGHPTALRALGGSPTGKGAIRASIDGSVPRAQALKIRG